MTPMVRGPTPINILLVEDDPSDVELTGRALAGAASRGPHRIRCRAGAAGGAGRRWVPHEAGGLRAARGGDSGDRRVGVGDREDGARPALGGCDMVVVQVDVVDAVTRRAAQAFRGPP